MKRLNQAIKTRFLIPALLFSLVLLFCVGSVSAAPGDNVYVNGFSGNDSWDGYTPETAKLTIGNATGTVNVNGTVNIADGTYTGTKNTGITISKNMIISGQSQSRTILDGAGASRIFFITAGLNVTIQNLTLINGSSSDNGGAICIDASGDDRYSSTWVKSNVTICDCTFTNNKATSSGGAIRNYGDLTLINCIFSNNSK